MSIKNNYKNLSFYSLSLLALLPVIPVFFLKHQKPIPSFDNEWAAIILGLIAGALVLPIIWRQSHLLIPRIALLPLLLMLFIALQTQLLDEVNKQHAQLAMLYLLWSTSLIILIKLLIEQSSLRQVSLWVASGLVCAAACSTFIEIITRLNNLPTVWGGTAQANNYGDLLMLGFASLLYLLTINRFKKLFLLVSLGIFILLGLSLTPSRSVWIYWIAMLVIAGYLNRALVGWIVVALGLYILFQFLWATDFFSILNARTNAVDRLYKNLSGASIRIHTWKIAWQLFISSPWLGQGFGQFDWGYFQTGEHLPNVSVTMEHAHNLIFHLLAELGLLPVLMFLGLIGLWLKNIFYTIKEQNKAKDLSSLAFYCWLLMLISIMGIHSLLEYPLWYAQFLAIASIVLSLGEVKSWRMKFSPAWTMCCALLISISLGMVTLHRWHYKKLEDNIHAGQTKQLFINARQAAIEAPLLSPYISIIFSLYGHLSDKEMRADFNVLNNVGFHFSPYPVLAYNQAGLDVLNNLNEQGRETMRLALAAYPTHVQFFIDSELNRLTLEDQNKTAFLREMAIKKLVP